MRHTYTPLICVLAISLPQAAMATPQDCPGAVSPSQLGSRLVAAEDAYASLELTEFTAELDAAAIELGCLEEVLTPAEVARYHRLQGLRQFSARNEDRAVQAFAASRAVDAQSRIELRLVPEGHVIRELFDRFPLENGTTMIVPAPRTDHLWFDGTEGTARPESWPSLVQLTDPEGQTLSTSYLYPEDALPGYVAVPKRNRPVAGLPFLKTRTQAWLAGGALTLGLGAGLTYALGSVSAASFEQDHPDWNNDQLLAHRKRTNLLVGLSAGFGAGALGLTVGALSAGGDR